MGIPPDRACVLGHVSGLVFLSHAIVEGVQGGREEGTY